MNMCPRPVPQETEGRPNVGMGRDKQVEMAQENTVFYKTYSCLEVHEDE